MPQYLKKGACTPLKDDNFTFFLRPTQRRYAPHVRPPTHAAYQPNRSGVRKNRTPAHQCMSHALTINHHRRRGARIVLLNSPASSHSRSIGPAPSIVIESELENPLPARPVSPCHPTPNPAQSSMLRIRPSSSPIINNITPKNIMDTPANNHFGNRINSRGG